MANMSDYLKGKQLEQAKEMISFAKSNNFAISFKDQSKDSGDARILITIYESEIIPKEIWNRPDQATWYFYLDDVKKDEGLIAIRTIGHNTKEYKKFAIFMKKVEKEFINKKIGSELVKIAREIINE